MQRVLKEIQDDAHNMRQIENDRKQLQLLNTQAKAALEKKTWLIERYDYLNSLSRITLLFGVLLANFGFWRWYYKFQIYQDRIIKAQSERWVTPRPEREQEEIPE